MLEITLRLLLYFLDFPSPPILKSCGICVSHSVLHLFICLWKCHDTFRSGIRLENKKNMKVGKEEKRKKECKEWETIVRNVSSLVQSVISVKNGDPVIRRAK